MNFKKPTQTYGWYPTGQGGETVQDRELRIAGDWFCKNLPASDWPMWKRFQQGLPIGRAEALSGICQYDCPQLVELLYPRFPDLFCSARRYTLTPELISRFWEEGPYSEEVLMQCCRARAAHLDATCLCALTGAVDCLEMLLQYGADPDGLENSGSWSYIELPGDRILPVTPMDCALLTGNEDCRLVLEMYGGKALHQHLDAHSTEATRP